MNHMIPSAIAQIRTALDRGVIQPQEKWWEDVTYGAVANLIEAIDGCVCSLRVISGVANVTAFDSEERLKTISGIANKCLEKIVA